MPNKWRSKASTISTPDDFQIGSRRFITGEVMRRVLNQQYNIGYSMRIKRLSVGWYIRKKKKKTKKDEGYPRQWFFKVEWRTNNNNALYRIARPLPRTGDGREEWIEETVDELKPWVALLP